MVVSGGLVLQGTPERVGIPTQSAVRVGRFAATPSHGVGSWCGDGTWGFCFVVGKLGGHMNAVGRKCWGCRCPQACARLGPRQMVEERNTTVQQRQLCPGMLAPVLATLPVSVAGPDDGPLSRAISQLQRTTESRLTDMSQELCNARRDGDAGGFHSILDQKGCNPMPVLPQARGPGKATLAAGIPTSRSLVGRLTRQFRDVDALPQLSTRVANVNCRRRFQMCALCYGSVKESQSLRSNAIQKICLVVPPGTPDRTLLVPVQLYGK